MKASKASKASVASVASVAYVGHKSTADWVPWSANKGPKSFTKKDPNWGTIMRADRAVFEQVKKRLRKHNIRVVFVDASRIASRMDKYDMVIVDYVGLPFLWGKSKAVRAFKNISSPKLYPSMEVMRTLNDKCAMYQFFKAAKIPHVPFVCMQQPVTAEKIRLASVKLRDEDLFLKPSFGFEDFGIERVNTAAKRETYAQKSNDYGVVIAQNFVATFGQHLEMRNYFAGGKWHHAIFTDPWKRVVKLTRSEAEARQHDLVAPFRSGKKLAIHTLEAAQKRLYKGDVPGLARIDVGCCYPGKKIFVNEIEFLPGLFALNIADVQWTKQWISDIAAGYEQAVLKRLGK